MRTLACFFLVVLMGLAQGCQTHSSCARELYAIRYTHASFALRTLQAMDKGDSAKAHQTMLASLSICLAQLNEENSPVRLDERSREMRIQLARQVLDYAQAHQESLAAYPRSLGVVSQLKKLLNDPADVRRVDELQAYLTKAAAEKPERR